MLRLKRKKKMTTTMLTVVTIALILGGIIGNVMLNEATNGKAVETWALDEVSGKSAIEEKLKLSEEEFDKVAKENQKMSEVVSRGEERKTKIILDYNKLTAPRYIVELTERMCYSHGFDSIREIYNIMSYESKFDPSCHATVGEDSLGLLQVNVASKAHQKRNPRKTKLFDPAYNLDYQLDELKIYYDKGKALNLTGIPLTLYVARYGQRPNWEKCSQMIISTVKKYDKEYLNAIVKEAKQ